MRDGSSVWVCVCRGGGGGGLMREIKTPQQDFALKMQEGLMHERSIFVGHYGIICYL